MDNNEPILFWKTHEDGRPLPYGGFSNFSRHPFTVDGIKYRTSEHYFQAMKFPVGEHRDAVINAEKPNDAALIGRDRSRPLRSDWETVKLDVMRKALRYKFDAYPDLQRLLLSTDKRELVEASPMDDFWGIKSLTLPGNGKNWLGKLLMELRDEL